MVDFRDIIQKRKNKEFNSDNTINVNRLIETNSNLEEKIDRLYRMLGGDENVLVKREKRCDLESQKIAEAILKLAEAKKEINQMIEEAHYKLKLSEQNEKKLNQKIGLLTAENVKLKRELQRAKEFGNQILKTTPEDMVQFNNSFSGNSNSFMDKKLDMTNHETRLYNIEKTIMALAGRLDQIQNSLEKLTDPITSSMFDTPNSYDITEKFLDS